MKELFMIAAAILGLVAGRLVRDRLLKKKPNSGEDHEKQ